MSPRRQPVVRDLTEADVPIWSEALFAAEFVLLHASPVYYGLGVPRGDGSAVIVIPGFLGTDLYLMEIYAWLERIGYRPFFSGIGLNAECPNLLIQRRLQSTLDRALDETGKRVHLIGHSLGGIIARSLAAQQPENVASVITLGAPFRGAVAHRGILRMAEVIRANIVRQHGKGVLPDCYTGRCTCDFLASLHTCLPPSVVQTAIYTRNDGVVDWHYCVTGEENADFEVPGSHIGLAFNPTVYSIIANRLARLDTCND